jgi:hypothetical protein
VNRIWDSLRALDRHAKVASKSGTERVADRRWGPRLWSYAPVFVYRRMTEAEAFYGPTEALRVNGNGGLITLTTVMRPGQP